MPRQVVLGTEPKKYALTLRKLDPALHRSWKAECLLQGITMEVGALEALELWVRLNAESRRKEAEDRDKKGDKTSEDTV